MKMEAEFDLRKNWYYLSQAVKELMRQKAHPRHPISPLELPYRIVAAYEQKRQSARATDLLFAEELRL